MDVGVRKQVCEEIAYIGGYCEEIRQMLNVESPRLVVTANDRGWHGAALVAACRAAGIPSLCVQDGIYAPRASQRYFTSDVAAVMGDYTRRNLIAADADPDSIVVTGQPRYDALLRVIQDRGQHRITTSRSLGLDSSKKLVLFATQPNEAPDKKVRLVRAVTEAVDSIGDAELLIKIHPRESLAVWNRLIEDAGLRGIRVLQNASIDVLLAACDVLLTRFSTTALEAMLLDKPVVTVNLDHEPEVYPYASSGAAIGVTRIEDLRPAIEKALFDRAYPHEDVAKRAAFVTDHAYAVDGKAAHRVADLAESILRGRSRSLTNGQRKCKLPVS
jgi:UDP-N-acetylglucosamine 2-epimerase